MNILHIDSSITGDASVTRKLSAEIVDAIRRARPDARITRRDVVADPLPHLDGAALGALAQDGSPDAEALAQFLSADVIVIGAPMYNFSVPSQLKAWIDRLLVAGKTFRYGPDGPEGLAGGRTVIVASSRGGIYSEGSPVQALDFQEPYLRTAFGLIGVTDVRFVRAEGVNFGPDARTAAIEAGLAAAASAADGFRLAA